MKIQAEDPGPQRLVMPGEDGAGQVIERRGHAWQSYTVDGGLGFVSAVLDDRRPSSQ